MGSASDRFYIAMAGGIPDRVPVLPKIWLDLAAALTGTDIPQAIEDPFRAMEMIVQAGLDVHSDGARLFHFPARQLTIENGKVSEVDREGRIFGRIDMEGGLATQLERNDEIDLEDPFRMAFVQFWNTPDPLVRGIEDVKRIAVPSKSFYREYGFETFQKALIRKYSDRITLIGDCASATLAFCVLYRKMANALTDFITDPGLLHALMEKGVEIAAEKAKFNIDCGLNVLRLNDSVANMSVISPDHFRALILPHMKALVEELHAYQPGVKIYCHICGNILPVLEDLIQIGLDCIGPLDPLGGFSPKEARSIAGDRVALMGGVNTMTFLNGTPEKIISEARLCMETFGKKGYILGSGCVVPRRTPRENLLALHEAAEQYGTNL